MSIAVALGASAVGCGGDTSTESTSASSSSGSSSSSGGGGGAGGAMPSEYEQYCQAAYDRDVKCNNMPGPTQVADCLSKEACDNNFWRDGIGPSLHKCLVERGCMTSDDTCIAAADAAQPDSASSMAYGKACTEKLMACTMAGTPFGDDSCFNYKLVKDGLLDKLLPCFMGPCDMVTGCILNEIGVVYDPCGGMK